MKHFLLDPNYGSYLSAMGFSVEAVLKRAKLPEDLFAHANPSLTAEAYFRFMQALEALSPDAQTPIRLAASEGIAAFSPPIFAAYCSANGLACLKRLAQYKPLIGPLLYQVREEAETVSVEILSCETTLPLPEMLVGIEFAFLVGLIRKAAKAQVVPLRATAQQALRNPAYAAFIGIDITTANRTELIFSRRDMLLPFISHNESLWSCFAPELNRRLAMLDTDDSYAARVRSALMELLPSGRCAIEDVAAKLGYSKRSLQRKLQEESTSFQQQLNHTRELLAKHYVGHTAMRTEDIAYLLGYQDVSSFLRAFAVWTGETVGSYRRAQSTVQQ